MHINSFMKRTKIFHILLFLLLVAFFSSCASPQKIAYFQDIEPGIAEQVATPLDIKIRANDKISIVVNSKDADLSNLFNLPVISHRIGRSADQSLLNNTQQISGYTVGESGDIDFPVIGKINVAGMTREQIAAHIKQKLITEDLVKDPVVTVEFMNLGFSVLGEVNKPGRFNLDRDKTTLLEAISMAGDLTIYGKRDAVYVLRQGDNGQISYSVDLSSMYSLYASPVFYVQQNDVIYIEPNTVRARQSTVNGNNLRSTSFWISLASLLTSVAVLIVRVK